MSARINITDFRYRAFCCADFCVDLEYCKGKKDRDALAFFPYSEQIRRKGDFNERINRLGRVMDEIESGELRHSQGVNQLQEILADANPPQNIETESALILAKALAYTGQKESAITMAEQLLQQPGISVEEREKAQELKANIESGSFELSQITLPQEIIRLENILEQPVINPALSPELLDQQGFVRRINPNADLER